MKKLAFVVMFALMSVACFAQNIYSSVSASTVANLMRKEGYSVSIDNDGDIKWQLNGYKSFLLFKDGKQNNNTNFYFYTGFGIEEDDFADALILCNEYNKTQKFGKSFVEQRNDGSYLVCYQLTLNISKGVTEARMVDFFDDCRVFMKTWKEKVADKL